MKNWAQQVFRHMPPVALTRGDGTAIQGRGAVVSQKDSGYAPQAHQAGALPKPLFVFTGDLEAAAPGDVLTQGGRQYTVLGARRLVLGGQALCLRAVLEERGGADEGP